MYFGLGGGGRGEGVMTMGEVLKRCIKEASAPRSGELIDA